MWIVLLLSSALLVTGQDDTSTKGSCTVTNNELTYEAAGGSTWGCCMLTQKVPEKPFPSLTQCYKYNTNEGACCRSGHDQHIQTKYKELLSETCLREFTHLEFYFCLGCNSRQYDYVDEAGKVLYVCQSFAKKLFDKDRANQESDNYERCGLNMYVRKAPNTSYWEPGKFEESNEAQVVMPYQVFKNESEFLNELLPPYFEGYTVEIVPDGATTNGQTCFSAASRLAILPISVLISVGMHLLLV